MKLLVSLLGWLIITAVSYFVMSSKPFNPWLFLLNLSFNWVAISFLFAYGSGWSQLAKQYRTRQPPPNNLSSMNSGRVGWVSFKGCLNIGVTSKGLYLSVFPLLRLGHPPLLIPWTAVVRAERTKFLFQEGYRLHIGSPLITKMHLPQDALTDAVQVLEQKCY
jgi:hypothetical protein